MYSDEIGKMCLELGCTDCCCNELFNMFALKPKPGDSVLSFGQFLLHRAHIGFVTLPEKGGPQVYYRIGRRRDAIDRLLGLNKVSCPNLCNGRCRIYQARPPNCRNYPLVGEVLETNELLIDPQCKLVRNPAMFARVKQLAAKDCRKVVVYLNIRDILALFKFLLSKTLARPVY